MHMAIYIRFCKRALTIVSNTIMATTTRRVQKGRVLGVSAKFSKVKGKASHRPQMASVSSSLVKQV
jgi:hypothetical protein